MRRLSLLLAVLFLSCSFDVTGLEADDSCGGDAPLSDLQQGVCAQVLKVCVGGQWVEPDYTEIAGYEISETSCDGLDNDCDGTVDAGECGANSSCGYVSDALGCYCDAGYLLDGEVCVDENECLESPCDIHATCTNTEGGFTCECDDGYEGDGFTCTDTNACDPHPCHPDAECIPNGAGYICSCTQGFFGDGMSCSATSCKVLKEHYPLTGDGTQTINTGTGGAIQVYCDMTSDFGTGYTMIRLVDAALAGDQGAYRAKCASYGLEVIVPRTRAHAKVIRRYLGGAYPPLVNVYPKFDGATGLENFEGRCKGFPCSFYLSDSNSSYNGAEPSGNNNTNQSLYLWYDDAGDWGGWDDADNRVDPAFSGSVVCSTNDNPEPPELTDCQAYIDSNSVWNKGVYGISGVYAINPNGIMPMDAFCDQRTDGGGWTTVLNYVHQGGTNPPLVLKDTSLPLVSSAALGIDESTLPQFWGHASNNLLAQFTISEVRFYGVGQSGRIIDFTTVDETCVGYIKTGSGNCSSFRDNYHGLSTQNANLPQALDNGFSDQADLAMTQFPFFKNSTYHWAVRGYGDRWEVDDYAGNSSQHTIHRVFVRRRPKGESCLHILTNNPGAASGYYAIDPDGPGGSPAFMTYCDMETDGGGWTLVAIYGKGYARPTQWSDSAYPRPGASFFNSPTLRATMDDRVFLSDSNNGNFASFSINAATLWSISNYEVLGYVGGSTDDYITAQLPTGCNFFDGSTWCEEDTFGPFTVRTSDGSVVTNDGYACTTAHGFAPYEADTYDEFGLHIIDGFDSYAARNCFATTATTGHQSIGRLFTTFEMSTGGYWSDGVNSHWNPSGDLYQSGALFIR